MTCPICNENHDPNRPLSFDGFGVNLCGEGRSRFASVPRHHLSHPWTDQLGELMAAAPRMHAALLDIARALPKHPHPALAAARALLAELPPPIAHESAPEVAP